MFARTSFLSISCVLTEHWKIHTPVAGRCRAVLRDGINYPRRAAPRYATARRRRDATRRDVNVKVGVDVNPIGTHLALESGIPSYDATDMPRPAVVRSWLSRRVEFQSFTATTRGDVFAAAGSRDGMRTAKETDGEEGREKCIVSSSISCISLSYGMLNTSEHEYTVHRVRGTRHSDTHPTLALRNGSDTFQGSLRTHEGRQTGTHARTHARTHAPVTRAVVPFLAAAGYAQQRASIAAPSRARCARCIAGDEWRVTTATNGEADRRKQRRRRRRLLDGSMARVSAAG